MPHHRPPSRAARRFALAGAAAGLLIAQGCIRLPWAHPSIAPFEREFGQEPSTGDLTVHFLGTSSLLFRDAGGTSILMDGFVSRPGKLRVVPGLPIEPSCARIRQVRDRLRIDSLSAVFVGHSHYDHAMDAPVWAQMTGATLLGSLSTRMLARGIGLAPGQDILVQQDVPLRFGPFELTFVESVHGPPDRIPGSLYEPLRPPARMKAWKTGLVYSVFIRHRGRTILVQSSAGYLPGALHGRRADVVYLAIGGLGHQPPRDIDAYWSEVVRATGARRVILVHWDDFFRPLTARMVPTPYHGDDVPRGMGRIAELAAADRVDLVVPRVWQPADPFAGMGLTPAAPDTPDAPASRHTAAKNPYCPAGPPRRG
ncbi:MAG TPA: MBL fold metallo-hydrolase [Longimicrobium sp.]|nr:MBL fold metallo-hydrolase [Longimicrobium sp.]